MKLIKILICLVVLTSLFLQIQGIKHKNSLLKKKSKNSASNILDWLFGDWKDIQLQVTDQQNHYQEFKGKIRHVFFDQAFNIPFGIEFQGLTESKNKGDTGFVNNVIVYEKLVNQGNNPQPVLDLRFIKDCAFTDNGKDWFGDWTIYFNVVGQEKYQAQSSRPFGNLWNIKLIMPAADRNLALSTKDKIYKACLDRSKQINALRQNAIATGDQYYSLYDIQRNKNTSLAKSIEQGQTQANVLKGVQSASQLQSQQIQQQIDQNQQQLQAAVHSLSETQQLNQGAQLDVEKYTKDLESVKLALDGVKQSQSLVSKQITDTQAKLNEAINLQNSQKDQAAQLAQNKQQIQTQAEADKAELARLVKQQEEVMAKAQAEFEAKQAELKRQQDELAKQQAAAQAAIQQQQAQVQQQKGAIQSASEQKQAQLDKQLSDNQQKDASNNQALSQSALSIEALSNQLKSQQQQSQLIDQQRQSTEKSISQIQEILEQKRTVADQLASKLSFQQAYQQQQDQNLKNTQADGQKKLQELAAKEKAQLDLLDQSNKVVQAAQQAAKKAADDLTVGYLNFNNAINSINTNAKAAQYRTQQALEGVYVNQHKQFLDLVISNNIKNAKRRMQRLAKLKIINLRLARLQLRQAKKVRNYRRKHL